MKRNTLLKSTLGLLAFAGACMPISSWAENDMAQSMTAYGEGALYDNLSHIQSIKSETAPSGAQGPLRTESMGPTWPYGEGARYDNLSSIQSAPSEPVRSGAQGLVRTESMNQAFPFSEDTP